MVELRWATSGDHAELLVRLELFGNDVSERALVARLQTERVGWA